VFGISAFLNLEFVLDLEIRNLGFMEKLLVIVGPTASGKTEAAIALAKEFGGEIVNADSRQVYKALDIGTAKPARDKNSQHGKYFSEGIEHHCLDLVEPDEEMTVALWKQQALQSITLIKKRNKISFLVGGTWLYILTLVDNYDIPAVAPNQTLRRKMLELLEGEDGLEQLKKELLLLDPKAATAVDLRNPRRVMRALEVSVATGKPFTEQLKRGAPLFETLQIGIERSSHDLDLRIRSRVSSMMEQGFFSEVKELNERYGCGLPALSGIGYSEFCRVLDGALTLEQAVEETILHTKQFAKKQRAWFGRDKRIQWVRGVAEAQKLIQDFLLVIPSLAEGSRETIRRDPSLRSDSG